MNLELLSIFVFGCLVYGRLVSEFAGAISAAKSKKNGLTVSAQPPNQSSTSSTYTWTPNHQQTTTTRPNKTVAAFYPFFWSLVFYSLLCLTLFVGGFFNPLIKAIS